MHVDYNALKRRVCYSHPEHFPESVVSSAFVAVDLKSSLPETEYHLEMEAKIGARMKLHIKGCLCLDPLEFMKAFWGPGL